jgi:hypothetical protein
LVIQQKQHIRMKLNTPLHRRRQHIGQEESENPRHRHRHQQQQGIQRSGERLQQLTPNSLRRQSYNLMFAQMP